MNQKTKKSNKLYVSKKTAASVTIALLSLAVIGGVTLYTSNRNSPSGSMGDSATSLDDTTGTQSEDEQAQADALKQEVADQQEKENQASDQQQGSSTKKMVIPVISSWGQNPDDKSVVVSSFVSTVYENGGTCTLTLEKSGKKVMENQTARKDATTTTCGQITIPRNLLSAGTWAATVLYSSDTAYGTSESVSIEVK